MGMNPLVSSENLESKALRVAAPRQLQVGAPTPVGPAVLVGD